MLKHTLLLIFTLVSINSFAKKDPVYPITDIPIELLKNANAIIRYDNEILKIKSSSDLKIEKNFAITIMNAKGEGYANVTLGYDKHSSISELKIAIYDAAGKLIERVKSSDIDDYSASGGNLYSDDRVKHYNPVQKNYPYTVVYSYKKSRNSYIHPGGWSPYKGYKLAVQESKFEVSANNNIGMVYKAYNFDAEPEVIALSNETSYVWHEKNLKAKVKEPFAPHSSKVFPMVRLVSRRFRMDDANGSMSSWQDFGKWMVGLNKGRDILDESSLAEIKELVKDCKTDFEKVKTLYEYLQNKTRYVSIQVGIGGFQPFEAQFVHDKGYGDCKALANYMNAILKVVDIPSYYSIVNAGSNVPTVDTTFVHDFANHIILMVPLQQDTVWLECTSKYKPCGFLGSFTDNRKVLAITEEGGKLFHTPSYPIENNTQIRTAKVTVTADGNAEANVTTTYNGLQQETVSGLLRINQEDQKKELYEDIDLPDFKINEIALSNNNSRIPSAELKLKLAIRNYASKSGDRLFIPLNLMNKDSYIPKKMKERKTDICKKREYYDCDSIQFTIPEGYTIESLPQNKSLESDFGKYEYKVTKEDNLITYVRKIEYRQFQYPAERYEDLRKYLKSVVRADKAKMVLKKSEITSK
jgi:transglutaminase-like putative cysteine protease